MGTRIAVGGVIADRYRLLREVGHGGMGVVYVALDQALQREVAVKILHPTLTSPDFLTRFEREAAVLAKLRSPHIVTIHDHGRVDDLTFLVTELFPDGDLQSWIRTNGALDVRAALDVSAQIAEALADAHEQGVVHRDVKPANVLVWLRQGRLRAHLGDFGIAQDGSAGLTATGGVLGSLAYMAPERHLGASADARGDVYSLGCLMFAAVTGSAPYAGTDFQLMNAHIHEPVPELGAEIEGADTLGPILSRCLAKDPQDRFQTAEDLRGALLDALGQFGGAPTTGSSSLHVPAARQGEDAASPGPAVPLGGPAAGEWTELRPAPDDTVMKGRQPAPVAEPVRKPRRWMAFLAVLLVLLVGGGAGLGVALTGSTPPDEPLVVEPEAPPPPVELARPRVEAKAAYRAVAFEARGPRTAPDDASVEMREGSDWVLLDAGQASVPVPVGGQRVCAAFRLTADAASSPGPTRRVCAEAKEPTVRLLQDKVACRGCGRFDVRVAGFRSGVRLPVTFTSLSGERLCRVDCRGHYVLVGKDGRGSMFDSDDRPGYVEIPGSFKSAFYVKVGKVQERVKAW